MTAPPFSNVAEASVLGCLLLDPDKVFSILKENNVTSNSFYKAGHRTLFESAQRLFAYGKDVDAAMIANDLDGRGDLALIGGEGALTALMTGVASASHVSRYIEELKKHEKRRDVFRACEEGLKNIADPKNETASVVNAIEESFMSLDKDAIKQRAIGDVVKSVVCHAEHTRKHGPCASGLRTGIQALDNALIAIPPKTLCILAARPGQGKTALGMGIAMNVALGEQEGFVHFFSVEMGEEELVHRAMCSLSGVPSEAIRGGLAEDEEWELYRDAGERMAKAPILIDDTGGIDIAELRSRARRMKKKHNTSMVVVDYLQIVTCKDKASQGRTAEVEAVSNGLKAMAKELDLPVFALAQLRRPNVFDRKFNKPTMNDLKQSGAIEQDADLIALLRRPSSDPLDPDNVYEDLAIIDIEKWRHGTPFVEVRLGWNGSTTTFYDRIK